MPQPMNDAEAYGVRAVLADVPHGEAYWRVTRVHHLSPDENHGLHHLFVDILDEMGRRLYGSRARVTWEGGSGDLVVEKPANEPGANFPMFQGGVFAVQAAGRPGDTPLPSDRVENVHTNHPSEGEGNAPGQHSFLVVFQRAVSGQAAPPPPLEESSIRGRVIRGAGQIVVLTAESGEVLTRVTVGTDETYRFDGLPAGTYTATVTGSTLSATGLIADGSADVTAPDLELPPSNWVAAITENTSTSTPTNAGHSLVIVSVVDQPAQPVRLYTPYWSGATNRTGTKPEYGPFACEFGPLQAGTYTVEPEGLGIRRDVWVDGSGRAQLEFRRLDVGEAQSAITGALAHGAGHTLVLLRDGSDVARAPVAADGSFRFSGLPAGTYRLRVDGAAVESDDLLLDGSNQVNVSLSLISIDTPEGGTVFGHLAGGAGRVVILEHAGQEVNRQTASADGAYRFPAVPAGVYRLSVADTSIRSTDFVVEPNESVQIDLVVSEAQQQRSAISGQVNGGVDHDIVLQRDGQELARTTLGSREEFEFSGLPAGIYALAVEDTDAHAGNIVLDGTNHVTINLSLEPEERADSVVSGVVRHGAGHVLALLKDGAEVDRVTLDDDGRFLFANLPAGTYHLHVIDSDVDERDLVMDGINRREVELTLPATAGVLRGAVSNGASLTIVLWAEETDTEIARQTLGPDGAYRFSGLPAGRYRLSVEGTGVAATGLRLDGEQEMVVNLALPVPATDSVIWGVVSGGEDHDLVLADAGGAEAGRITLDESGAYRFEHLAAGVYRLYMEGTARELVDLRLDGSNELQANLQLPSAEPADERPPMDHYLLVGPREREKTRVDLLLVQPFVLAFSPTCGFRVDEALHASRVTIVGDTGVVSEEAEQRLVAAGCQVQRLAGESSDDLMAQVRARIEASQPFL